MSTSSKYWSYLSALAPNKRPKAARVFAQAAAKAHSVKVDDLAKAMRADKFDTVIGQIGFDAKGDVIGPDYVVYVWDNGKYSEIKG